MTENNESTEERRVLTNEQVSEKVGVFHDRLKALAEEVFDPEDEVCFVGGVQFGGMGDDESLPVVALLTNLAPCVTGEAIRDLYQAAEQRHDTYHNEEGSEAPMMATNLEDLPEDVRESIQAIADEFGVAPENIIIRSAVHMDDLANELPEWLKGSDVAEAMTGGDIADPDLGYNPTEPYVASETEPESGTEQEG